MVALSYSKGYPVTY